MAGIDYSKVQEARKAGYSDAEITNYLLKDDPRLQEAKQAGYSDAEILDHFKAGVPEDVAKSAAAGGFQGVASTLMGAPLLTQGLGTLAAKGISAAGGGDVKMPSASGWLADKLGGIASPQTLARFGIAPGGGGSINEGLQQQEDNLKALKGQGTGYDYEPQTTPGAYAKTGTTMVVGGMSGGVKGAIAGGLAGLGVQGAHQAAEGTPYDAPATLATAVMAPIALHKVLGVGGSVNRAANRQAANAAEKQTLFDEADKDYTEARGLGLKYNPNSVDKWVSSQQKDLTADGHGVRTAGTVHGILDDLRNPETGATHDLNDFMSARQQLRTVAQDYTKPSEQRAASLVIKDMDRWLSTRTATSGDVLSGDAGYASQLLSRARGNYAAGMRSEIVEKALRDAGIDAAAVNSGLNIGNKARQKFASILKSDKKLSGFTDAEIDQMTNVVKGSAAGNALRRAGNMLGGGGGIAQTGIGALGAAGTYATTGDPKEAGLAGVGAGILGALARRGANASTLRQIDKLSAMVRARNAMNDRPMATPMAYGPGRPPLALPAPPVVPPAPPSGVAGPGFTMQPGPSSAAGRPMGPQQPLGLPGPQRLLPPPQPQAIPMGPPEAPAIPMRGPNPGNLPAVRSSTEPAVSMMTGPQMRTGAPAVRNDVGPAQEGDITGVSFRQPQLPPPGGHRLSGPEGVTGVRFNAAQIANAQRALLAMASQQGSPEIQNLIEQARRLASLNKYRLTDTGGYPDLPNFLRR